MACTRHRRGRSSRRGGRGGRRGGRLEVVEGAKDPRALVRQRWRTERRAVTKRRTVGRRRAERRGVVEVVVVERALGLVRRRRGRLHEGRRDVEYRQLRDRVARGLGGRERRSEAAVVDLVSLLRGCLLTEDDRAPPRPALPVLPHRLLSKRKERSKEDAGDGHEPPEDVVVHEHDLRREEARVEVDAGEVGVHGGPGGVGAEGEGGEVERVGGEGEGPDHLDGGHEHEAQVARGREARGGVLEVPREVEALA